jgi:eukaryotic-like serine/threonine-protein kinase
VHRDFKPHNVLRSASGHVYVTDFGLARGQLEEGVAIDAPAAPPAATAVGSIDSPLTQTGVLVGTPAYMAPEQFAHRAPDARADQFAFCVTAWEALTGERPFRGDSLAALELALARGVPEAADLPPRLRAVLERGLARDPADRYPDMAALLRAFSEALEPPPRRRPPWRLYIVAAATAAAVGATVATVKLTQRSPAPPSPARTATAAAGECANGERAFDTAWAPGRRSQALREGGNEAIGAIVVLDSARRDWVAEFGAACMARSTTTRDCLLRVRDDLAALTEDTDDLPLTQIAIAAAGIEQCTKQRRTFVVPRPRVPVPPTAPEPPAAPPATPPAE